MGIARRLGGSSVAMKMRGKQSGAYKIQSMNI